MLIQGGARLSTAANGNGPAKAPRVATHRSRVAEIIPLGTRVKGFHLSFVNPVAFHFQAGQYVQALVPLNGKTVRRSYSIASAPWQTDAIELCITNVPGGTVSGFFHQLKVGETVEIMGPMGRFTLPEEPPRDIVFVATGSGVAPLRSMIHDRLVRGIPRAFYLIFGNRFEEDILYRGEWEALKESCMNFRFLYTLSQPGAGWCGEKGYVQDKIERFIPGPLEKDYYICGLNKMITGVQDRLLSLGVPKEQIHYERYD